MAPCGQRRLDHLGEVLGAIGGDEERFGLGDEVRVQRIVQDVADQRADLRPARLAGDHGVELGAEAGRVRGLPTPFGPFEDDVATRRHGTGDATGRPLRHTGFRATPRARRYPHPGWVGP